MPLPNDRLIHRRFQAAHADVVAAQMTAECTITRPSGTAATWDDTAGRTVYPEPQQVYAGRCRFQWLSDPQAVGGDESRPALVAACTIAVPIDTGNAIQVGDAVRLTSCPHDEQALALLITVVGVSHSSISWQRNLACAVEPPATR